MKLRDCSPGQRIVVKDPHIGTYEGTIKKKMTCSLVVARDGFLAPTFVPESYFYGDSLVSLAVGQMAMF